MKKKIMIVDDNPTLILTVKEELNSLGWDNNGENESTEC